jgi:hypothetical protein
VHLRAHTAARASRTKVPAVYAPLERSNAKRQQE